MVEKLNCLENVKQQYEALPYPPRDPQDELKSLAISESDAIDKVNFYGFGGRQTFRHHFRVLVAGGGTGDAVISWAEQLRDFDTAEVVYLDMSAASMKVAQERAKIRNLKNITWIHDSLLDLPRMDIGQFDFINCSGVLHHLASPEEGLAALKSVLKKDGVINLMVYAKYGRLAIYPLQELMRKINKDVSDIGEKIANCKEVLKSLPANHWFHRSPMSDHKNYGDSGLYDLLLHEQDRAYDVPELYGFVEGQGLKMAHFCAGLADERGNLTYSPRGYLRPAEMLRRIEGFDLKTQQAVAEILHGNIYKHTAYLKCEETSAPTLPSLEDLDYIPNFSINFEEDYHEKLSEDVRKSVASNKNATSLRYVPPSLTYGVNFAVTKHLADLLHYLDGHRSLKQIFECIRSSYSKPENAPSIEALQKEFANIFDSFLTFDWIFLRAPDVPKFKSIAAMHRRLQDTK